jgi:GMP synthase (glutamine-hydrolysing)
MPEPQILILDFGGQYSQLIARRVRECNVYSIIRPYDFDVKKIKELNPGGIIFSGGPNSVTIFNTPQVDSQIFELGIPILGICYGLHLMSSLMSGGKVEKAEHGEYGKAKLEILKENLLLSNIDNKTQVWMSHGDHVLEIPEGFEVLA